MAEVSIPHFAFPFRLEGGRPATVEQDTEDEVAQCVEVLVSTTTGARELDQPDYGIADPTFSAGVDEAAVLNAVEDWEPRAVARLTSNPDELDELVTRARVTVETEGG